MRMRQPLVEFSPRGKTLRKLHAALRMNQQFRPFAIRPYIWGGVITTVALF